MAFNLFGLLALLCANVVMAQIPTATFVIPELVESSTTGHFVKLTMAVAKEANLDLDIQVLPARRAMAGLKQGNFEMLFPALEISLPKDKKYIRTKNSLDCKRTFVYSKKGGGFYKDLNSLRGKRVGLTDSYNYVPEIMTHTDVLFEMAPTDVANVEKLMKGRIDAFIIDKLSAVGAFAKANASDAFQVDLSRPISEQESAWVFQGTAKGQELADQFDAALNKLAQNKIEFDKRFNGTPYSPKGCAK